MTRKPKEQLEQPEQDMETQPEQAKEVMYLAKGYFMANERLYTTDELIKATDLQKMISDEEIAKLVNYMVLKEV